MDFELPEELKLLKNTVRTFVDRELIPVEMNAMDGPGMRPEVRADLERKAKDLGLWLLDVPTEYWRSRPRAVGDGRGLGRGRAHRRAAAARTGRVWPRRAAGVVHAKSGAEGEISLPGPARREDDRLRPIRARCRLRSRGHAHHRRTQGRSLRDQRLQTLDHEGSGRRFSSAGGSHRPLEGQSRRPEHVPGRHRDPWRQDRTADAHHDERHAVRDRIGRRDGSSRESDRQGRRGHAPGAILDYGGPALSSLSRPRRGPALLRSCGQLCQATRDVRRAARRSPGRAVHDRR